MNETFEWTGLPHNPIFNVDGFLSVLERAKKRSFMYVLFDDVSTCNIEVGGAGDVVLQ